MNRIIRYFIKISFILSVVLSYVKNKYGSVTNILHYTPLDYCRKIKMESKSGADSKCAAQIADDLSNNLIENHSMKLLDKRPAATLTGDEQMLSKRRRKKMIKAAKYHLMLPEKRKAERLRMKKKREEARKNNVSLGPTRQELRNRSMAESGCKVSVALDFSFDDLMSSKDICKCISQTLRCYSANRRAQNPLQVYLVNINGESLKTISRHNGYTQWDIHIKQEPYLELFQKNSLVYLTSESDNVIEKFEDDKIYIIGAFVDHNAHKGLCWKRATEQGIQHGRLPLSEHLDMKSRKVLTINHVFEIMLNVCNGKTWKEALMTVLPQRKNAVAKGKTEIESVAQIN